MPTAAPRCGFPTRTWSSPPLRPMLRPRSGPWAQVTGLKPCTSNSRIWPAWSTRYSDSILLDTTPPTTTASPPGAVYNTGQIVTLTCSDGSGSGCDKIYYTTDGSTPTTSSLVYSAPINISVTTALKFFAKDHAGNSEAVETQGYTIDTSFCPNSPVKIGPHPILRFRPRTMLRSVGILSNAEI